jgi:hypothetical protein
MSLRRPFWLSASVFSLYDSLFMSAVSVVAALSKTLRDSEDYVSFLMSEWYDLFENIATKSGLILVISPVIDGNCSRIEPHIDFHIKGTIVTLLIELQRTFLFPICTIQINLT